LNESETKEVVDCYGEIGYNNLTLGFIDKALDMLYKSLNMKINLYRKNHFCLASTYGGIGEVYR
jgi:hypothetical protein